MKLQTKITKDRAELQLFKGRDVIGMASMLSTTYREVLKSLLDHVANTSRDVISKRLGEFLWSEALSRMENPEIAKKLLADLGLNQEVLDKLADILAILIAQSLAESVPEHR